MNIAVSFPCVLLKTCLICHKEVFKTLCCYHILDHFSSIFLLLDDVFTLFKIY